LSFGFSKSGKPTFKEKPMTPNIEQAAREIAKELGYPEPCSCDTCERNDTPLFKIARHLATVTQSLEAENKRLLGAIDFGVKCNDDLIDALAALNKKTTQNEKSHEITRRNVG
jgi:hypothetical protein